MFKLHTKIQNALVSDYACVCGRTRHARVVGLDMRVWSGVGNEQYQSTHIQIIKNLELWHSLERNFRN